LKQRSKSNPPTLLRTQTTLRQSAWFSIISSENTTDPELIVMTQLPIIGLRAPEREAAQQIADACKAHGFFYVVGHDVDEALALRLARPSHQFFALPNLSKATLARYAMALGGLAWCGWFPLRGELTPGGHIGQNVERMSLPRHRAAGRASPVMSRRATAWSEPYSRR
jgi:isopenicillin N synthase-like dioxygenase